MYLARYTIFFLFQCLTKGCDHTIVWLPKEEYLESDIESLNKVKVGGWGRFRLKFPLILLARATIGTSLYVSLRQSVSRELKFCLEVA